MKPRTIDEACEEAANRFTHNFGTDVGEHDIFKLYVLDSLRRVYADDPVKLLKRATQIVKQGMNALDLIRYLTCACIAEGEDRKVTYEEALKIVGERPLKKGEKIYHFSNTQHKVGFRGHIGMCFNSEDKLSGVVTDSIDYSMPIYMHTCEVVKPKGLIDHDAKAYTNETRDVVIAEVLLEGARFDPLRRWYEQKGKEAIRVVDVRELTRREK